MIAGLHLSHFNVEVSLNPRVSRRLSSPSLKITEQNKFLPHFHFSPEPPGNPRLGRRPRPTVLASGVSARHEEGLEETSVAFFIFFVFFFLARSAFPPTFIPSNL
ncbi:hypothetical protein EYF80_042457 [Liparis tanakae]|uniref:Uncharacterized protein n=1 Tax=Liparis tanakae TaxID=230148 RepID=A0A4Z2G2G5_9TELE|nr:hypothetical protein EYF80_042457 [Liparis tanakae]